MKAEAVNFR